MPDPIILDPPSPDQRGMHVWCRSAASWSRSSCPCYYYPCQLLSPRRPAPAFSRSNLSSSSSGPGLFLGSGIYAAAETLPCHADTRGRAGDGWILIWKAALFLSATLQITWLTAIRPASVNLNIFKNPPNAMLLYQPEIRRCILLMFWRLSPWQLPIRLFLENLSPGVSQASIVLCWHHGPTTSTTLPLHT